jgi:arylsulfatase A
MRGGKTSVHEGGCRVPLFIRWPARITKPRAISQIASHIDIYPTVLDLCGVVRPPGPAVDGASLLPLIEGRETGWPDRLLFTHNPISETNRYPGAVRTQRYRLVREIRGPQGGSKAKADDPGTASWQLYDMQADPGETRDVARDRPEIVDALSRRYEAWLDDVSRDGLARFPIPVGHPEENPVVLNAPQAYYSGSLRFSAGPGFAHDWLTGWTDAGSQIWFDIDVVRGGNYELEMRYACTASDAGSTIRVRVGEESAEAKVSAAAAPMISLPHRDAQRRELFVTRSWGSLRLSPLNLSPGRQRLTLEAVSRSGAAVMEFKSLALRKTGE